MLDHSPLKKSEKKIKKYFKPQSLIKWTLAIKSAIFKEGLGDCIRAWIKKNLR